jgi:DNA polymerase II small subunit/DNA polymerase delta subunit B
MLRLHQSGFNDYWNCNGINIMTWQAFGTEQCYNSTQPTSWDNDAPVLQLKGKAQKVAQTGCN